MSFLCLSSSRPLAQIKIDLTAIHEHWKVVLVVLSILFVGCLLKVLACALISPTYNIKPKHGVVLGLILKVKGIVELIFYSRMNKLKVMYIYSLINFSTLLEKRKLLYDIRTLHVYDSSQSLHDIVKVNKTQSCVTWCRLTTRIQNT